MPFLLDRRRDEAPDLLTGLRLDRVDPTVAQAGDEEADAVDRGNER